MIKPVTGRAVHRRRRRRRRTEHDCIGSLPNEPKTPSIQTHVTEVSEHT